MNLQESIRRILKGVAKKLSNKLHCDRHGSCVHFAELFVGEINNTHPELLKEFEVIEGYVDVKFGEGKPQEHTWIRLSDDEVIDPTFMQFTKYDKNAKYSRKRTKSYTGQEYYDKGVRGSWFSKRREEQPDAVFKGGLKESIRRILREELESRQVETIKKILREETELDEQQLKKIKIVKRFINTTYPNFNKEGVKIEKRIMDPLAYFEDIRYEYRDLETNKYYAIYHEKNKELQLNREIFESLENYLGDKIMEYIIDWFNYEFNKNAESFTF